MAVTPYNPMQIVKPYNPNTSATTPSAAPTITTTSVPSSSGSSGGGGGGSRYNVNDTNFLNQSADSRLKAFGGDRALAQQEIARVKDAYMNEAGSATPERLQQMHSWADQVRSAAGISNDDPVYGNAPNSASRVPGSNSIDGRVNALSGNQPSSLFFNGKFTPGKTVDTSPLKNAIDAYNPGSPQFSMGDLKNAMGQQGKINMDMLLEAINAAKTAGGSVNVQAPKYQSPEQLSALMAQMNGLLAPQTEAQKNAAQTGFNSNMQKMRDQWASRGMLASGGAAAQEQEGANALSGLLSGIQADQQAKAIPLAFQYANLGLNEDAQRFGQEDSNRRFSAGQAQNYVGNLSSGMNQEQGMKQQNISNFLNALGMQDNQQQNYIRNVSGLLNTDIGQNQWSQQFGEQQQQNEFNRWLGTNQLNSQNNAQQNNQLMDALRLQEQQRMSNIGAMFQGSQIFGNGVTAPGSDLNSWASQFAGKPTQAAQQNNTQNNQWQQSFDRQGTQWDKTFERQGNQWNQDYGLREADQANRGNYQQWQMDMGDYGRQGNEQDSFYLAQALTGKTRDEALQYIQQNAREIASKGGNIGQILQGINSSNKYPGATNKSSTPADLWQEAIKMAQKDPRAKGQQGGLFGDSTPGSSVNDIATEYFNMMMRGAGGN